MSHACSTHNTYRLTCEDYDTLVHTRSGACWRCSQIADRLEVDHDHALGINAVRGMLCSFCNNHLGQVEGGLREPDALDTAYLSNAWHRGRTMDYRPDERTIVRNIRIDAGLWRLAGVVTKRRRETISGVIKRLLAEYVEQHATDEDRAAVREDS